MLSVSGYKPFRVDLQHLMENIRDHYRIEIEEAAIVENVDNCIDECYTELRFSTKEGKIEILMLGDGMSKEVFLATLPRIAATTKIKEESRSLGRYGWGMKVCLWIAKHIRIETKRDDFHGAQSWKISDKIPLYRIEEPVEKTAENFTKITIELNDEYKGKITPEFIERTLRYYYPTILHNAKVRNRYGQKRILRMFVNSESVEPPLEVEYEKRKPIKVEIGGEEATGYVYLSKEALPDEQCGLSIIIHGRRVTRDFFGYHGDKSDRITGYIHADMLIKCIAGDKTILKRSTYEWRKLSEEVAKQLSEFLKEIGAIKEEKLPEDLWKHIHIEINNLIKQIPELQELAKKAGVTIPQEVLIPKQEGDISTLLVEGSERGRGLRPGSGGGQGVPLKPGESLEKAPSNKPGEDKAVERKEKRKRGLQFKVLPEPQEKKEAWFSPEGIIYINSAFSTYRKAEEMGRASKEYHMGRCAVEAILEYAAEVGIVNEDNIKVFRSDVLAKWGELRA